MSQQAQAISPVDDLPPGPVALSIRHVCAKLGVSHATVYNLITRGEFPRPFHIGSRSMWSSEEVDAFLRARLAARDGGAE